MIHKVSITSKIELEHHCYCLEWRRPALRILRILRSSALGSVLPGGDSRP